MGKMVLQISLVLAILCISTACSPVTETITITEAPQTATVTEVITMTTTEQTTEATSIPNPFLPNGSTQSPGITRKMVISYSYITESKIGDKYIADPGHVFLIVYLNIENQGYESFNTNPNSFKVVIDNVKYNRISIPLENELKEVEILNDGRYSGDIAYEVKDSPLFTIFGQRIQLVYENPYFDYDIEWVEESD